VVVRWRVRGSGPGTGGIRLKVIRPVGDAFMGVNTGPTQMIASNLTDTTRVFAANQPIAAGDLVALDLDGDLFANNFAFKAQSPPPGAVERRWNPSLLDGQTRVHDATTANEFLYNADIEPTSTFTLGAITRNKKKGTATIKVNVPNPGELTGSGKGVKASSVGRAVISKSVGAGAAQLLIKTKGKKKRKLNETGKVKLILAVTYTPTGGSPSTQSVKVKLKKKL
jgi:hypothetical protein